jgi:FkbM family methyltransferase
MSIIVYSSVYKQEIKTNIDFIFKESILQNKLWEENIVDLICKYMEPDTNVLDIGANIGLISLGVLLKQPTIDFNVKMHAFECNNDMFDKLKFNTRNKNIELYQFGLGDKLQLSNMSFNPDNNGYSYLNNSFDGLVKKNIIYNKFITIPNIINEQNIHIPILPLDFLVNKFTNKISVMKIDIEGFEYLFLLGAEKIINNHRPVLIIEIIQENYNKCEEFLKKYNYNIQFIGDENYLCVCRLDL